MLLYNDDLRLAHYLKEWFYDICQSSKYSYQRTAFWEWVKYAEKSGIPEFEDCAKTYRNWSDGIVYIIPGKNEFTASFIVFSKANRHLFLKPFPDFLYGPCNISNEVIFIYNDSCIREVRLS